MEEVSKGDDMEDDWNPIDQLGAEMFGYDGMIGNYEQRKIARDDFGKLIIDTARVTDGDKPIETAISSPEYNHGGWIIVEIYDTVEQAQEGHSKWLAIMTTEPLPEELTDIPNAKVAKELRAAGGQMTHKRWKANKRNAQ